jgi:hypothetical protein
MIGRALIVLGLLAASYPAAAGELGALQSVAAGGHSPADCHCRINGNAEAPLGDIACLRVGEREYTAQCTMSQNNPSWRFIRDGCPPDRVSMLSPD